MFFLIKAVDESLLSLFVIFHTHTHTHIFTIGLSDEATCNKTSQNPLDYYINVLKNS